MIEIWVKLVIFGTRLAYWLIAQKLKIFSLKQFLICWRRDRAGRADTRFMAVAQVLFSLSCLEKQYILGIIQSFFTSSLQWKSMELREDNLELEGYLLKNHGCHLSESYMS